MNFICGCEVNRGEPIAYEVIKKHYEHTMQVIFFWELIFREGEDLTDQRGKLSKLRIDLLNAIEEMFPEVKGG